MSRALGRLITLIITLLLLPALCACSAELLTLLTHQIDISVIDAPLVGMVAYMILHGFTLLPGSGSRSHYHFLRTLRHEFTHAITSMLGGARVTSMLVNNMAENTGHLTTSVTNVTRASVLAVLAPYFVPLLTLPLLPLRFFVQAQVRDIVDGLIGFTFAFHLAAFDLEFRQRKWGLGQTDITHTGCIASYTLIAFGNLFMLTLIKLALHAQLPASETWGHLLARTGEAYTLSIAWLEKATAWLRELLRPYLSAPPAP